MTIDIIFPVLNEENRLSDGVRRTLFFLSKAPFTAFNIIIVDNGSTDRTEEIAKELVSKFSEVRYLKLQEKGVGLAFREGIKLANADIIGYMDVDLSTHISHLFDVYSIFENELTVDIVTGSRNLPESKVRNRIFLRTLTSKGLGIIVKCVLGTSLSDYMCGFKFFRKETLEKIMPYCSDNKGWFYCAELLIYAEWLGYGIYELPVRWLDERENSKVTNQIIRLSINYLREILKLIKKRKKLRRLEK